MTRALILSGWLSAASCVAGCFPSPKVAESTLFAAELEHCMQTSPSCADYVRCQHSVQRRYEQPLSGTCEVVVDGGDQ